jgi:predicted RecA/RadA family phage recombinase
MAKNYVSEGDVLPWTNTTGSAVASGQVIVMGHALGVALVAIANGASGAVAVEGVFEVPKVSAAVFAQGEKLVFDISANSGVGAFDDSAATPATGDITGGAVAWRAGANTETTALVKLTPGNTTKTA